MRRFIWILTILPTVRGYIIDDTIKRSLLEVLHRYFKNESILLVEDQKIKPEPLNTRLLPNLEEEYQKNIIRTIMKVQKWSLQIYNSDMYVGLPPHVRLTKLKNCIFFLRETTLMTKKAFHDEMNRLHKNPLWNPGGRNLIVVKKVELEENNESLSLKILRRLWRKSKAVDNLVMVAQKDATVRFYTWFPYKQPNCSRVREVVHLNTFKKDRFLRKKNLFPDRIGNTLNGCELVAATDICVPYVLAEEENSTNFVDGLEIRIINLLSEQMNFKLTTIRPDNMWVTKVNGSVAGAFKLLVEEKIDLAFSCLMLSKERYLLAQALPSYFDDSLTWFVPSPRHMSHSSDIYLSFSYDFWLLVILTLMISAVTAVALVYGEHGFMKWMSPFASGFVVKLIGMSVAAPVTFPAKKPTLRIFIFLFYLYSLHITIAFQASLFGLFREPHHGKYYTSLLEILDAGLFFYLRPHSKHLYNQSDHEIWNRILQPGRFQYIDDFGEAFSEIAYDKTAVALFIRSTGIYMISVYFTDEYGVPEILWLRNKFSPYPVTMFLSPGHPLFYSFQSHILRLMSSGFVRYWARKTILAGKMKWREKDYKNIPLSLSHLNGAFFLLLLMLAASFLVFLSEHLVYYLSHRTRHESYFKKHKHRCLVPFYYPTTKFFAKGVNIARMRN